MPEQMNNPILPTIEEIAEIVADVMRSLDDYDDEEITEMDGGIDLTIATNGKEVEGVGCADWGFQTGDNSYTGACYHYRNWAVRTVGKEDSPNEVAEDLLDQLSECFYQ